MKNINPYFIHQCYLMDIHNFEFTIQDLFGAEVSVELDSDGINIVSGDGTSFDGTEIAKALSEHFDVKVTSFHTDNCEPAGVWIVYESSEPLSGESLTKAVEQYDFEHACGDTCGVIKNNDLDLNDFSEENIAEITKRAQKILSNNDSYWESYWDSFECALREFLKEKREER